MWIIRDASSVNDESRQLDLTDYNVELSNLYLELILGLMRIFNLRAPYTIALEQTETCMKINKTINKNF